MTIATKESFFQGLPPGKTKGFCEPPEGNPYESTSVDIQLDCTPAACQAAECHMFRATLDKRGNIVSRTFVSHPPECKAQ